MDFLELIKERYSVREFSNKKVEDSKLELILQAAKFAPTACNFQPQRLLVLNNEDSLNKLKECTPYHFDAPLAILVCYDKNVSWKRKYDNEDGGKIDASIVGTHMLLEIVNIGLGSTWVGSFDPEKIKSVYNLPENIIPVLILPIGYASENSKPNSPHHQRLELNQTTFYNSFS